MRPVFIGGDGRSGTTLLASMLGVAADAVVTPESQFKTDIGRFMDERTFDAAHALRAVERSWRFKIWGMELDEVARTEAERSADWPQLLRWLVRRYALSRGRPDADVWIDHTPINVFFVPSLACWFPDARFVHLVRDGRALLASVRKLDWDTKGVAPGARYWGFVIGQGLAAESYLPPDRITRVHYETLVTSPESTLRMLCERLELTYTPEMLAGGGFVVPGYTRSQHLKVGKPPDPSRLDAWRKELSPREIEIFEATTADLLPMLGYTPVFAGRARPATTVEKLRDVVERVVRAVGIRRRWRRVRATWAWPSARA